MKYKCVHCGSNVHDLYRRYSPSVLKLIECSHCHELADKYIEYDLVIIMIDLVLLNKQAYRHILYNSSFQNHWKLAVVLLLTETYSEWAAHRNIQSVLQNREKGKDSHTNDDFEGERSFYFICVETVIGSSMFVLFVFVVTYLSWLVQCNSNVKTISFIMLWKALVLSSFGKFLLIPGLIWGVIGFETNILFIMTYTFLSQLQVYSVVCNTSRLKGGVVISLGYLTKYFTRQLLNDLKIKIFF